MPVHPGAKVHPSAKIAPGATIEDDVRIGANCEISDQVIVKTGARLRENIIIAPRAIIRQGAVIHDNCIIADGVVIGVRALLAPLTIVSAGTVTSKGEFLGDLSLLNGENPEIPKSYQRSLKNIVERHKKGEQIFEGRVMKTSSNLCIVSFPGKFIEEWNILSQKPDLSTACVFLPSLDPKQRYGQHHRFSSGRCYCHDLYGEEKEWGCEWFEAWLQNIKKASKLGLEFVVVFFEGEKDRGIVDWSELTRADLANGEGLGRSQKGEVAYLRKNRLRYRSMDIDEVRGMFNMRSEMGKYHEGMGNYKGGTFDFQSGLSLKTFDGPDFRWAPAMEREWARKD